MISPVLLPIVATPVDGQLHVPPVDPSVAVAVAPVHTADAPPIASGSALTVTDVLTEQPEPNEYVMVAIPAVTPVTIPVDDPTVAIPGALLVHVPPVTPSLSVVARPMHTCVTPVIAVGTVFTVTVAVALQPAAIVYVIPAVPAVMPLTTPVVDPTLAMVVAPLVHVPPVVMLLSVVVCPAHKVILPVIAAGIALTLIVLNTAQPVPNE